MLNIYQWSTAVSEIINSHTVVPYDSRQFPLLCNETRTPEDLQSKLCQYIACCSVCRVVFQQGATALQHVGSTQASLSKSWPRRSSYITEQNPSTYDAVLTASLPLIHPTLRLRTTRIEVRIFILLHGIKIISVACWGCWTRVIEWTESTAGKNWKRRKKAKWKMTGE
jgi:hypothetical protein